LGEEHETIAAVAANSTGPELDGPALRRALAQLPAGQRTAVELTKLRELSVKEAAAVSGMSEGALKVATHRGLARLRWLLGGGRAE
jgi:RNA polymerase sigma-70 factor (ECF subfamily)